MGLIYQDPQVMTVQGEGKGKRFSDDDGEVCVHGEPWLSIPSFHASWHLQLFV
jgi:hypothetical protein